MAQQPTDAKGNKVRFIRVNGRVVPIRDKDPSRAQMKKNYDKHGDGANQAAAIDAKYRRKHEKKVNRAALPGAIVGAAGVIGALKFKSSKSRIASGLVGAAAIAVSNIKSRSVKKSRSSEVSREREYVRKFGTTSDGSRPSKNKSGV
jgi:hypothetical protein